MKAYIKTWFISGDKTKFFLVDFDTLTFYHSKNQNIILYASLPSTKEMKEWYSSLASHLTLIRFCSFDDEPRYKDVREFYAMSADELKIKLMLDNFLITQ